MTHEWVSHYPILTVTAVRGARPEEVAARFGVSHGTLRERALSEVTRCAYADPTQAWLVFEPHDDVLLVWEENTWEASRREVAEAVSRDGATVLAVHRNEKVRGLFTYAENGDVIAQANTLEMRPEERLKTSPGRAVPPALATLDMATFHAGHCLGAMATLFGVDPLPPTGEIDVLSCRVTPYPRPPVPPRRSTAGLGRLLGTLAPSASGMTWREAPPSSPSAGEAAPPD